MELENIVANTVLLKAREGKLTHEKELSADSKWSLNVSHYAEKKGGNNHADDGNKVACGLYGSVQQVNPADATENDSYAILQVSMDASD